MVILKSLYGFPWYHRLGSFTIFIFNGKLYVVWEYCFHIALRHHGKGMKNAIGP
jgi:hypothetical protein